MHAEASRLGWAALLLWAVLLTTGCVTLASGPGSGGLQGRRLHLQTTSSVHFVEAGQQEWPHRRALPSGWPDFSSDEGEALLAPFLACTSPAEVLALQERVDMPRLVEALDDWRAVRLGALGTPREEAAGIFNRKRTSFLLHAAEHHGAARTEILALFVLDSAHDDDLREVLFLLARDKRLEELLELMPTFRMALEARGLKPEARPDRDFEWTDVGRGLARAGRDALSSSPMSADAAAFNFSVIRDQLPPPYQEALDKVERKRMERHYAPGNVVLGSFDQLTFGVPLGFYGLLAGTGHGAHALTQGQYERATRELAPAALLVGLYAGGKGMRVLSETRGVTGGGTQLLRGLQGMEPRLSALKEVVGQLEARLGVEGLRELARDIQASREAGRFVAVGGVDAALALREARGDVARAQAWLSEARSDRPGPSATRGGMGKHFGGVVSLVDEQAGLTPEVVEARLARVELDATGPRLPRDVAVLETQRPSVDAPVPGAQANPRWGEYVAYYEKRLGELKERKATKGPLRWEAYESMQGWFARGLAFERVMVELLRADAALPKAQRRFLGDFDHPRIETYVGVWKPESGLRFADVLVIEQKPPPAGRPPRLETFSFKSRNLSGLGVDALNAQIGADARDAVGYYGETLDIRRPSLKPLVRESSEVPVQRLRLIYEGGDLKPQERGVWDAAVNKVEKDVPGVEVLVQ